MLSATWIAQGGIGRDKAVFRGIRPYEIRVFSPFARQLKRGVCDTWTAQKEVPGAGSDTWFAQWKFGGYGGLSRVGPNCTKIAEIA